LNSAAEYGVLFGRLKAHSSEVKGTQDSERPGSVDSD